MQMNIEQKRAEPVIHNYTHTHTQNCHRHKSCYFLAYKSFVVSQQSIKGDNTRLNRKTNAVTSHHGP